MQATAMENFSTLQTTVSRNADEDVFPLRYWELVWYSLIFLTGTAGNLLVCLVICKSNSVFRSTPFNMYICSLALADSLVALVVLPNYLLATPIFNHPDGVWGDIMCNTITGDFLNFYFSAVSLYLLMLISIERLRTISKYQKNTTYTDTSSSKRGTWLAIVLAWVIPLATEGALEVGDMVEYKGQGEPIIGSYCTFSWGRNENLFGKIYSAILLATDAALPGIIFIYTFYKIHRYLTEYEERVVNTIHGNTHKAGYEYYQCWKNIERQRKTIKILMIATFVFIVCWIPNRIMFFVMLIHKGNRDTKLTWNSSVYQVGNLLTFTGSCINPYLYAWQSKEFRRCCRETIKGLIPNFMSCNFEHRQLGEQTSRKYNDHLNMRESEGNKVSQIQETSEEQSASTGIPNESNNKDWTSRTLQNGIDIINYGPNDPLIQSGSPVRYVNFFAEKGKFINVEIF